MARKKSGGPYGARGGAYEIPLARKPSPASRQTPLYPAPDSSGPMQQPPSDNGPQRGVTEVHTQPGDGVADLADRQAAWALGQGHAKCQPVGVHPGFRKARRGRNKNVLQGESVFESGAASHFSGLDSAD